MFNDQIEMLQRTECEATAMLPTGIQTSATSELAIANQSEGFDGLRLARYCMLEEVVGLTFCVMTVLYIVTSLASLY